jgi:cytochrome c-type biogenesis protein CcmF
VTGTFLVRSGILNSVHTFASDPTRGIYILLFLTLMIFSSIFLLFKKYKKENYDLNPNSKETFILVNNWFMMFYLITVLLGTIYPIFTDVLTGNKISIGPPFYNVVIIPVVVIFLLIMAIGPKVKWIKEKFNNLKNYLLILLGSILINFLIIFLFKSYSILSNLIIISSLFLIISSLIDAFKSFKKNKTDFARVISHASFGFLIMFIGLNHIFSIEKDYNIKLGETKNFDNYSIKLQNLETENFSNYKAVIGSLEIKNNKTNRKKILKPEIRIYENPQTLTYEAAITTSVLKDYYLTMSNIDRSDYYNIKFQKKPLMIWIWISVIMITIGGFLRLFQNAKYN